MIVDIVLNRNSPQKNIKWECTLSERLSKPPEGKPHSTIISHFHVVARRWLPYVRKLEVTMNDTCHGRPGENLYRQMIEEITATSNRWEMVTNQELPVNFDRDFKSCMHFVTIENITNH